MTIKKPIIKTIPRKTEQKNIKIAFSGSGYLAPAHAGFAFGMMERGFNITEVAGTSGGSIVAAILATGVTKEDIKRIAFTQYPVGIVSKSNFQIINSLFHNNIYLNSGNILQMWLNDILGNKTFGDVKIPITIMATNLTENKSIEFSHKTTPNLSLAFACRASSSVPFIYAPIRYEGITIVDGGVRNNIPTNKLSPGGLRVGVRITGSDSTNINSIVGFSKQLINCLLDANEDNLVAWAQSTGADIVDVNCDPYDFLDAKIPIQGKKDLFNRGKQAALNLKFENNKINGNY